MYKTNLCEGFRLLMSKQENSKNAFRFQNGISIFGLKNKGNFGNHMYFTN